MKTVKEIINEGIPSMLPVHITMEELKAISKLNEYEISMNLSKQIEPIRDLIDPNKTIKMGAGSLPNIDTFVYIDGTKYFRFSPISYFKSKLTELNIKEDNISITELLNDTELNTNIQKNIDKLLDIETESSLKNNYPILYKYYKIQKNRYKEMETEIQRIETSGMPEHKKKRYRIYLNNYIRQKFPTYDREEMHRDARDFSVKEFCEYTYIRYGAIFDHIEEIYEFIKSYAIDLEDLELNKDRLNLLIINKYLNNCYLDNIDLQGKQECINYVSTYFRKNKDKMTDEKTRVTSLRYIQPCNYEEVTPKIVYDRYKNFLKMNPEIKVMNFDMIDFSKMNIIEIKEFIAECLKDLQANWDIIPDDYDIEGPIRNSKGGHKYDVPEEVVLEKFIDKKEFFASTDPFFRIKGKNTFKGYIGYIYQNGKVVLDRYYHNPDIGKLAYGDAIYSMNVENFYYLSHYPRKVIMKILEKDPSIDRIEHRDGWQDKVRKIIEKDNDKSKTVEEVKRLMKIKEIEEEK